MMMMMMMMKMMMKMKIVEIINNLLSQNSSSKIKHDLNVIRHYQYIFKPIFPNGSQEV